MVHQGNIGCIIETGAFRQQSHLAEDLFGFFMAGFTHLDLVALLVHVKVAGHLFLAGLLLALHSNQLLGQAVQFAIHLSVIVSLTGDDQGRARLVDQNRIHLVDDRVIQTTLNTLAHAVHHVVAQVVKTEFIVGAVGDIRRIRSLLLVVWHAGQVTTHSQTQKAVELAHPGSIARSQVVVHGNHMNAFSFQGIQVGGQGGHECFTFTGAHF